RPALAAHHGRGGRAAGRSDARRVLRHRRPRDRRARPRCRRRRPRLLRAHARACAGEGAGDRVRAGRHARAAVRGRVVRLGHRRLRRAQRRGPRARPAGAASRPAGRRPCGHPRDHDAARPARAVLPAVVRQDGAAARQGAAGRLRVHVPARERPPIPRRRRPRAAARGERLRRRALPALRRRDRGPARRGRFVSTTAETLASIREIDGLADYLDALEERLARTVASHPGLVASVGNEALAAGGKRLRPVLVFLATPAGREPSLAAGVAVELVHMATLVHDDLIDRAHFRRGKAAAWSVHGADAARATGDYLFARAFAELGATGDRAAVGILADATLRLARGEALQRTQTRDPATTVESYLERC